MPNCSSEFFLKCIPPAQPVLLIQDGHSSHVSIHLIMMARENNVCLLCLPAHTSHILQPLNVRVFKSFKSNFNKACGNYMKQNPGGVITADVLASLVSQAYPTAFTPVNVLSGFKKTGIYPFNPSSVNDRQLMLSPLHPIVCVLHWNNQYQKVKYSLCSFLQRRRYVFKRFEEGCDIQDEEYVAWVRINHPEQCLSVDSSSSVSATSDANHVKASSSPSSVEQNDDILVQPKPKDQRLLVRKEKLASTKNQFALLMTMYCQA